MLPALTGVLTGLIVIAFIQLVNFSGKKILYGLTLAAIGFIYTGFVWTNMQALIACILQAVIFLLLAYYGIIQNNYLLTAGFFLHGCWDMLYPFIGEPGLIPPHYDWFCLSADFVIGVYLLQQQRRKIIQTLPKVL